MSSDLYVRGMLEKIQHIYFNASHTSSILKTLATGLYAGSGRITGSHSQSMLDFLAGEFNALFSSAPQDLKLVMWDNFLTSHLESGRVYHSLEHIEYVLKKVNEHSNHIHHKFGYSYGQTSYSAVELIKMALFYHDIVYNIHPTAEESDSNELSSANLFTSIWKQLEEFSSVDLHNDYLNYLEGKEETKVDDIDFIIRGAILSTEYSKETRPITELGAYVVDCDLAIFGDTWKEFQIFFDYLVEERLCLYDNITELYKAQIKFYNYLLSLDTIFQTEEFQSNYEHIARANIVKMIDKLTNLIECPPEKVSDSVVFQHERDQSADDIFDMESLDNLVDKQKFTLAAVKSTFSQEDTTPFILAVDELASIENDCAEFSIETESDCISNDAVSSDD